jgi:thiamine biosynthesis lipoprotein
MLKPFLVVVLLLCVCVGRVRADDQRYQYTQLHMGVQVRLVVYAPDAALAERACAAAYRRIAALEDVMSDYRPTSELMRLCARAGGAAVPVSDDLYRVLEKGQAFAAKSGGAFDMTVAPYVQLWRRARKGGAFPTSAERADAARCVGWRKMRLDARKRTVLLRVPGMRLDLGGIGKGFAGDEALKVLRENGISRALYEAGGDIVVGDAPPGSEGWKIEVAATAPEIGTLTLTNAAVSTSGDTYQYIEHDGVRYSHILDPRTGLGLTRHRLVTVIAPDGTTSDALTKVVSVLGERGAKVARSYRGVRVLLRELP